MIEVHKVSDFEGRLALLESPPTSYQFGAEGWFTVTGSGEVRWRNVLIGQYGLIFAAIDQARIWTECAVPIRGTLPGDFLLVTDVDELTISGVEFVLADGLTVGASERNFYLLDAPYPTDDDPDPIPDEVVLTVGDFMGYLVMWAKLRVA